MTFFVGSSERPCQVCESDEMILNSTRVGPICANCYHVLHRIANQEQRAPTAADAMRVRAERRKVPA